MNWLPLEIVIVTIVVVVGIFAVLMVAFRNRPEMPEDEPDSFGDAFKDRDDGFTDKFAKHMSQSLGEEYDEFLKDRKPTSPPMPRQSSCPIPTRTTIDVLPFETSAEPDNSFINSAAIGYMTNSSIMGGMIGGNLAGGIVGDIARDGVIGSQPESPTIYEMPTQAESPTYEAPKDSGFSGGSDMGGGDF